MKTGMVTCIHRHQQANTADIDLNATLNCAAGHKTLPSQCRLTMVFWWEESPEV